MGPQTLPSKYIPKPRRFAPEKTIITERNADVVHFQLIDNTKDIGFAFRKIIVLFL
jgi:hypothetical protein